ncbi:MAG TPA: carbonic anhydrase [Gemmataceae bacterium]|nr:carbonic anhydrase [Gemmataceae bacterium]
MPRTFITRFLGLAIVLALAGQSTRADDPRQAAGDKVTPAEALQKLKDGNARFIAQKTTAKNDAARRAETAKGQKPFAIILACADSRVGPEIVFDQSLGDLFVIRVAGNVTDPSILGSIEYAVLHIGTPLVVVMGHEKCGAVAAVLEGGKAEGNLAELLKEVHVGDPKGSLAANVKDNAKFHADAMLKQSKTINDMVKSGRVQIVTSYYDLSAGTIEWLGSPEVKKGK